jgi:hypothetical protein
MKHATHTVREAILHSATLLKSELTIRGRVVVLDLDLGRMDLSDAGAKLIVRILPYDENGTIISVGDVVTVTGMLKKEERRTFLQATGAPERIIQTEEEE